MSTITWFEKKYNLSQVPSNTVQFSWLSKDFKQCHPWVFCKDYLQDAIHGTINKITDSAHGFKFDSENPPVDLENTRLMLSNMSDKDFESRQEHMLEFMNILSEMAEITPFILEKVDNPKEKRKPTGVYVLIGSKAWISSPPMVSALSLFVRMGYGHKKGKDYRNAFDTCYYNQDTQQKHIATRAAQVLNHGSWRDCFGENMKANYPASVNMNGMHGCGFGSWMSGGQWFPIKHFMQAPAYTGGKK